MNVHYLLRLIFIDIFCYFHLNASHWSLNSLLIFFVFELSLDKAY